jgi:Raf kinase inhibitor-like YbhB/YbcL family protein
MATHNSSARYPWPLGSRNMSNPQPKFPFMLAGLIILLAGLPALSSAQSKLTLTSPAIAPGAAISAEFACTGADRSPELAWSGAPKSTVTFALIVDDPDAPGGTFFHWVAYNIPASKTSLPAGVPQGSEITGGAINGMNSFGHLGYNGPCPPPGKTHHYRFHLYALDSALEVGDKADAAAIKSAMKGHVLADAELTGTFER